MQVNSVEEYLALLSAELPAGSDYWFRGHASDGWDLSASVFRTPARMNNELVLLKRFMQEARRHIDEVPTRRWDWVFLAQHHQLPTRLLDWSEGPLVGLYFASLDHLLLQGDDLSATPGVVWILKPTVMNSKAGFHYAGRDIPMFDLDDDLEVYSPFNAPEADRPPVAALAARNFSRISAQWGTFTVCNTGMSIELLPDHDQFLIKVEVPVAAKAGIRSQLAQLGLEDRTIYPDLFRLGLRITEVFT